MKTSLWLNIILLVLLGLSWVLRPEIPEPIIVTETVINIEVDTFFVEVIKREIEIVVDTFIVHTPPEDLLIGLPPLTTYYQSYSDSLISGELVALVRGELLEQKLFYTPHFSPSFIKTIYKTTTTTETIIIKRSWIQAGLDIGVMNGSLQVNPMVGYTSKDGYSFFYRYTPSQKGHNLGFLIPLKIPFISP